MDHSESSFMALHESKRICSKKNLGLFIYMPCGCPFARVHLVRFIEGAACNSNRIIDFSLFLDRLFFVFLAWS